MKKNLALVLLFSSIVSYCQVAIGTNNPDPSASLELYGNNLGFLPNRVNLLNDSDATTILNPANGLMVYHTGNSTLTEGIYVNKGTSVLPNWKKNGDDILNNSSGSNIYKLKYFGRNKENEGYPKPTLKINEFNIEFRFIYTNANVSRLQFRLINNPGATVIIKGTGHWTGTRPDNSPTNDHGNNTYTWTITTTDYNTWRDVGTVNWNGWYSYYYNFVNTTSGTNNYGITFNGICGYGSVSDPDFEIYSIKVDLY